ncbi:MAG TPA: hypothetical protein PK166_09270, partial [Candidatus Hydrogenedentes bacterium]|nr:hypothetical protein [Candidatus Hydrogenedentota bacterium]
ILYRMSRHSLAKTPSARQHTRDVTPDPDPDRDPDRDPDPERDRGRDPESEAAGIFSEAPLARCWRCVQRQTLVQYRSHRHRPAEVSSRYPDKGRYSVIANHERFMAKWYYIRLMSIRPHTVGARFR